MSNHYVCPCPDGCNGCEVPDFALKEIERLQARVNELEAQCTAYEELLGTRVSKLKALDSEGENNE